MSIIPEKILTQLICSKCSKYLSVEPVKNYGPGIVKCGRCSAENDDGIVSFYNKIVVNGLFPCVNRYEGCAQLLNYAEVEAHEKVCVSRTYNCPICSSGNQHTSLQLLQHYKSCHANKILEKPVIVTNGKREFESFYMYEENNLIFIIYLRCDLSENCFRLNAACLGPKERVNSIQQYIKCYLNEEQNFKILIFQTKKRFCTIFENNADSFKIIIPNKNNLFTLMICLDTSNVITFNYIKIIISTNDTNNEITKAENIGIDKQYRKIYLSDKYKKMNPNHCLSPCRTKVLDSNAKEVFPTICEFCETIFPVPTYFEDPDIFKCNFNHYLCCECYLFNFRCLESHELTLFDSPSYKFLRFFCRWNCGKFYSSTELLNHEDRCKKKVDYLDLENLIKKYFFSYSSTALNHIPSRLNIFHSWEFNSRIQKTFFFIVTREYFKFVLICRQENGKYNYFISHDYPPEKYHILLKIRHKNGEISRFINSFSVDVEPDDLFMFAVLLRKNI